MDPVEALEYRLQFDKSECFKMKQMFETDFFLEIPSKLDFRD